MERKGIICYRFRSEKQEGNVVFEGDSLTVEELKDLIEKKRMKGSKSECFKRGRHYEFNIFDMATNKSHFLNLFKPVILLLLFTYKI